MHYPTLPSPSGPPHIIIKANGPAPATDAAKKGTGQRNAGPQNLSTAESTQNDFQSRNTADQGEAITPTTPDPVTTTKTDQSATPNIGENVADSQREEKAQKIREKFSDILQVTSDSNCESIKVDISDYTDDVNVAGS